MPRFEKEINPNFDDFKIDNIVGEISKGEDQHVSCSQGKIMQLIKKETKHEFSFSKLIDSRVERREVGELPVMFSMWRSSLADHRTNNIHTKQMSTKTNCFSNYTINVHWIAEFSLDILTKF